MNQDELMNLISDLNREISLLPEGSISKKRINDREYYYHRVNVDGKRKETYVPFTEVEVLKSEIERRRDSVKRLKEYTKELSKLTNVNKSEVVSVRNESHVSYNTLIRTGRQLKSQILSVRKYKKRKCIEPLRDYIFGETSDKVFVIYGLRRTGKTTLIRQILDEMSEEEFYKAAFIQITSKNTLSDLDSDIRLLEENGYKYLFIDEVTLLEDFISGAAIFADIYASSGLKIVLSGTDSLGFMFSKEEQLFDRSIILHTTFIPYKEFEDVLGINGIDEYIRFGGTMSLSGINYNEDNVFSSFDNATQYIDTSIAKNIQHSLKFYEDGGHFRRLLDLYECGELTNVINRVIENINHRFTCSVIDKAFKSHDLSVTASNMLKNKEHPMNIKNSIDVDAVTKGMMGILEIINKEDQSVSVETDHMNQIKEYLNLLDLIIDINLEFLPETSKADNLTVITQPGMRYVQAKAIVENLLLDSKFNELNISERKLILDRLLDEVRGRMMEEIVLLETKISKPDKKVFKLQFAIGEFDMVVFDPENLNCEIYEIKHSSVSVKEQIRHLTDKTKCELTTHRYGEIKGKYVIYRGEEKQIDNIQYINVENYLKNLW